MPVGLFSSRIHDAVEAVRSRAPGFDAEVALILGTGLGGLASAIRVQARVPYAEIPGFPLSTVESHAGRLLIGRLGGRRVVAMEGRFHRYEGYPLEDIAFPVRVMHALGAGILVVSNACGGMDPQWRAGDLVLLTDHLNLLGGNPLVGSNDENVGPRFPDMSSAYDAELRNLARETARACGLTLREGVYASVAGPCLESPAEYRMLRTMGADAVGMSTVPEVIVARHEGLRVVGISVVTDMCLPDTLEPVALERILAVARAAEPALGRLVTGLVERCA
jgi:purine-nucleoside phosphorylase